MDDTEAYAYCMESIKRRLAVARKTANRKINTGYVRTNAELIALQLRKIAELIALSSICSHREDYERIRENFERDWNAKRILQQVEEINPNFYPKPTRQVKDPDTGKVTETVTVKDGYLTRDELINMVDCCADLLHATNPYALHTRDEDYYDRFNKKAHRWYLEIWELLQHHQVQLVDDDRQWWVVFKAKEDGRTHVYEFQLAVE